VNWTTEQVLALAPDSGSAAAGRGLATTRTWGALGRSERAAWGECQGSGAKPYQTRIDLEGPAFLCSCPSRKFPCKHALGLLLLLVGEPAAVPDSEPPGWVMEWLATRDRRAETRVQKETAAAPDPVAVERRAAQTELARAAKVGAGLAELERWLGDLLRRGLAAAQQQQPRFWDDVAARMVDAQAPGIARQLREMAALPHSGPGWPARLAERVGLLVLLIEGYRRLETLPEGTQADLRSLAGWTQREEDLLAQPGVTDRWLVAGRRLIEEERLRVQRTWLLGQASRRGALVLDFSAGGQPLDRTLVPGTSFEGELVFWPGSFPLRALVKNRQNGTAAGRPAGFAGFAAMADAFAGALARNPWLERFPALLEAAVPMRDGEEWALLDGAGRELPLGARFPEGWRMLALSGGAPVTLFGEWDGSGFWPLSAWVGERFAPLGGGS
jgi:hypothetical protein